MKFRKEDGFTGIDISLGIVIIFIFTSIITLILYNYNSSVQEIKRKSEAIEIAIAEIEKIKKDEFNNYVGLYKTSTTDKNGQSLINQPVENKQGFYKTIIVEDYTDIEGNENKQKDIVKRITVKILYNFKNEEQTVQLSTVISKES